MELKTDYKEGPRLSCPARRGEAAAPFGEAAV